MKTPELDGNREAIEVSKDAELVIKYIRKALSCDRHLDVAINLTLADTYLAIFRNSLSKRDIEAILEEIKKLQQPNSATRGGCKEEIDDLFASLEKAFRNTEAITTEDKQAEYGYIDGDFSFAITILSMRLETKTASSKKLKTELAEIKKLEATAKPNTSRDAYKEALAEAIKKLESQE